MDSAGDPRPGGMDVTGPGPAATPGSPGDPTGEPIGDPTGEPGPDEDLDTLLADLAGRVGDPDLAATSGARMRMGELGLMRSGGRLAELGLWWVGVRGDDRAAAPTRVLHAGPDPAQPDSDRDGDRDEDPDVISAVRAGRDLVESAVDAGCEVVVLSVADPVAARLAAAAVLQLDAVEAAGWPMVRRMDDEEWMSEVLGLRDGLLRVQRETGRGGSVGPVTAGAVLRAVRSPVLARATAVALTAAARRTPVLLDGATAVVAALVARRAAYAANQWWLLAQPGSGEPFGKACESLSLTPVVDLGLSLEDGAGGRITLAVLAEAAGLLAR